MTRPAPCRCCSGPCASRRSSASPSRWSGPSVRSGTGPRGSRVGSRTRSRPHRSRRSSPRRRTRSFGVPVEVVVAEDRPARLLLERSAGAALVVVGHRGHTAGDLVGIGSTTLSLLLAAPCPVLVLGPALTTSGER
ncbi:universal stress protein [Actinomycetospora chibensis]|uniref:Universal stress protein n=1 Tax=Actinomycetospora chibensis TaxID=663606 RepID=A0ABV9RMS0_9PSEU